MNPQVGLNKTSFNKLQAATFAQVNLLPSDIRDARKDRLVKRLLLLVLAGVAGVCVVLFIIAAGLQLNASNKLEDAHAETTKLQAEKTSLQYVVKTYTQLESAALAEAVGMSPEINWKTYLDGINGTLPNEQSLVNVKFQGNTATTVLIDEHPLMQPRVGTIAFVTFSDSAPDSAKWLTALQQVPHFQDPYLKTSEVELLDDSVVYKTVTTVEISSSAFSKRLDQPDVAADVKDGEK